MSSNCRALRRLQIDPSVIAHRVPVFMVLGQGSCAGFVSILAFIHPNLTKYFYPKPFQSGPHPRPVSWS